MASGMTVVDERAIRSTKDIVLQDDSVKDRNSILDRHMVSNNRTGLNKTSVAEITILADHNASLDIRKGPDSSPFANTGGLFDESGFMTGVFHCLIFELSSLRVLRIYTTWNSQTIRMIFLSYQNRIFNSDWNPAFVNGFLDGAQCLNHFQTFLRIGQIRFFIGYDTIQKILILNL